MRALRQGSPGARVLFAHTTVSGRWQEVRLLDVVPDEWRAAQCFRRWSYVSGGSLKLPSAEAANP